MSNQSNQLLPFETSQSPVRTSVSRPSNLSSGVRKRRRLAKPRSHTHLARHETRAEVRTAILTRATRTRRREHIQLPDRSLGGVSVAELAGVAFIVTTFFAAALFL